MRKLNFVGLAAFLIVLLSMPLGHAAMILIEHTFRDGALTFAAFVVGLMGVVLMVMGLRCSRDTCATLCGFLGGILTWTGWIEFCYVYFATRLEVAPLVENGEVVTKPEYLLMMSSVGFWSLVMIFYIFNVRSECTFFGWIQRKAHIKSDNMVQTENKNRSITTFIQTNVLLWTCYLVLLFAYDDNILGDYHPVTAMIALGCLGWSIYLFGRLMRYTAMGSAIRYAIPSVMIFWTFIEVLGRWGVMDEIWVNPLNYKWEMAAMLALLVAVVGGAVWHKKTKY